MSRISDFVLRMLTVGVLSLASGLVHSTSTSDSAIERIIALSPHAVEILFQLGVGDRIVGTTDFADYPEAANMIPRIGGYDGIQIDRVLELEPDLVIAWEGGNPTKDLDRIQSLGVRLYRSETRRLGDIPLEIETLAGLVGKQELGVQLANAYRVKLDALKQKYQHLKPVTFFYQLWSNPLRTMAGGSWINEMFSGCGGQNVFQNADLDYPQVSLESVIEKAPEVIVVPTHHGGEVAVEMWQDWQEIPAVQSGRIEFFDGDLLHRFSSRTLEGMQQVCERFDEIRNAK